MPFNNSGVFNRVRNWVNDATAGIKIRADYHDNEDDGFAVGLSNCICKDGQTLITQNIPWNSKRITGLADPINPQDASTKAFADTKLPLTGGTISGDVAIGGKLTVTGDIWANSATIRFGGDLNKFFYHDGSKYQLGGGALQVNYQEVISGKFTLNGTNNTSTNGPDYIIRSGGTISFRTITPPPTATSIPAA